MLFIEKYRKWFFIGIIICCIFAGIFSINRYRPTLLENALGFIITPIQSAVTSSSKWIGQKTYFLTHMSETEAENIRLKAEVEQLKAEKKEQLLLQKEIQRLSELLKIDQKYDDYPTIGAEIIGKDKGSWYNTFLINKGTRDGLDQNMVVLGVGGLVGRILESGYNYSKIISLIDDSSSIAAKSVRTEDIGWVKGGVDGMCRMDYIDLDAQIVEGDEIVTSQLSDIYPPGIIIGYIKDIKPDANGLTKYAIVEPVVDFKQMETVLVINEYFSKPLED